MASQHVHTRRLDRVGILTLDKPEVLNAFDLPMAHEFVEGLHALAGDAAVRCILLRGAGKHFCAGGDLSAIRSAEDPSAYILELARVANRALLEVRTMDKPVLAELKGAVAGGGVGIALACDLRIASATARFSLAFMNVGLSPDMGTTWSLPRLVGRGKAFELAVSHDPLPAKEAHSTGLVNRLVPAESLAKESEAWATELCALPPLAVREVKALLNDSENLTFASHLDRDSAAIARMAASEDFAEGSRAFFEKRPPRFEGR